MYLKRLLALLCSLALVFCLLPSTAFAEGGNGNIDGGGGSMGQGTSSNFWNPGNDGVRITVVDADSGTAIERPCAAMLAPGGRADLRVTLRAAKSGLWWFKLQKLTVRDHLGLFAADCPPDGQTWELCVLPPAEGEADGAGNTPQNRAEQESRAGQDICLLYTSPSPRDA